MKRPRPPVPAARAVAIIIFFFGVGNEKTGMWGNMRPQYYADEYRRYQTYVRIMIRRNRSKRSVAEQMWMIMTGQGRY